LEDRNLPSTFTVDHLADDQVGSGLNGSLRYCIANVGDNDTITFADSVTGTIDLSGALPNLSHSVSIEGPGPDQLTVRRNTGGNYRIFTVGSGTTVSISDLKIANGYRFDEGGGIFNGGTLTVSNCAVSSQSESSGGGIFNQSGRTMSITNSTVSGLAHYGGGICNFGTMTVTNTTITASVGDYGGGIANGGMMMLTNATVSGNVSPAYGGGIDNEGTLAISHSTIASNWVESHTGNSPVQGGGILNHNLGTLTITDSTFSGNHADSYGSDEYYPDGFGQGGGIYNDFDSSSVTISACSFSGNYVHAVGFFGYGTANGCGGGIDNEGTQLTISNSTFSGNYVSSGSVVSATSEGGGIHGSATISNSTFSGNYASTSDDTGALGGGIFGDFSTRNTIIAGNYAGTGRDLYGNLGSLGHNLIANTQGGSGFGTTDLLNVDPLLGPLQNNGGTTKTMALLTGSPALNAGDPAQLGVADQRGVVRSGGVNIGAYQASASALVVTGPATATAGTPFDLTVKAVDTLGQTAAGYTGTVTFTSADPYGATVPADYHFTLADGGMHTFGTGATLYTAGNWDVTATDTVTASITGAATIAVSPAAADHLLFLQQPTDTAAGQMISPALMVAVVDQFGNVVRSDNTDMVTLTIGSNPSGGTLSSTLTVTVVNGIATFSDLSIDLAGMGYTLHANTAGLTDAESDPFSIT
jgi:hypothetical protein